MLNAAVIPNSAIIVNQSTNTRLSRENHGQKAPKEWKVAPACPLPAYRVGLSSLARNTRPALAA